MNTNGFFMPPAQHAHHFAPYCQYSGDNRLFSPPECDALIAIAHQRGFGKALIGSPEESRIDEAYRKVEVACLPCDEQTAWLYERVTSRVVSANHSYWHFDLSGLLEPFQVLRYEAAKDATDIPGHYDAHQDFGSMYMSRRKLSLVAQLSNPADYAGCLLTIQHHQRETLPYIERGDGVLFPSWTPHFVSPIEHGTRYAMVNWVAGPPFR